MTPEPPGRREERPPQNRSADAGEAPFSTGGGGGDAGRDWLAEAVAVLARIRRHGQWESAQTHSSLLPYLIEESWELVDAVADGDRDELVSELGDLLLQVLFHAAIGAERADGAFDIHDVAGALLDKLRRRAPYWFDDAAVGPDAAEQDRLWQQAKRAERAERAGRPPRGVVDGIPWDMPALALGQKVLERARSAGVPEELIPAEMRVVRVDPVGAFSVPDGGSGSAEVAYRRVVRRFADSIRRAEASLRTPPTEASADDWRAGWPRR